MSLCLFTEEGFGAGEPGYVEKMSCRADELLKEKTGAAGAKPN